MDRGYLGEILFELGDFKIEAKKGTISNGDKITQVEPKVIQVLLVLCEHANSVVEQERLFELVWPNSVFSPNSLRRCIAELRKALNDQDKTLISTHSKVGYSLNAEPKRVRATSKHIPQTLSAKRLLAASLIGLFAIILTLNLAQNTANIPNITEMQPLTATDSLEDFLALSPSENRIAFTRQIAPNEKAIWIRDIETEVEHQIDVPAKNIRNLTWSVDENAIFYIEVIEDGWTIWKTTLTTGSQVTVHKKVLSENNSSWISTLVATGNDTTEHLYFIAKQVAQLKLFQFPLDGTTGKELLSSTNNFKPYDLTLNTKGDEIAITGQNIHGIAIIKFITLDSDNFGQETDSFELQQKQRFSIAALPEDGEFILNNGRQLFHLNQQRDVTALQFEHSQFIRFVKPSPLNKTLYLVSSQLDTDLHLYSNTNSEIQNPINSNAMDYFPTLSPDNKWVSFYSTRYGVPQLFVRNISTLKTHKVFENPQAHLFVDRSVWNDSSEQLAFSVGYNIYIKSIADFASEQVRKLDIQGNLLAWMPDKNSVLIQQKVDELYSLVQFDLVSEAQTFLTTFKEGHVSVDKSGQIILVGADRVQRLGKDNQWQLAEQFGHKITRSIRHQQSLYLLFKNSPAWYQWSIAEGLTSVQNANEGVARVATISNDQAIAIKVSETRRSDILTLHYE